jgi:hypothetical protein
MGGGGVTFAFLRTFLLGWVDEPLVVPLAFRGAGPATPITEFSFAVFPFGSVTVFPKAGCEAENMPPAISETIRFLRQAMAGPQ